LGVPTRHIHTHNAVVRRDDFDHTVALVTALVQGLDKKTVAALTSSAAG
jgi:endoglucanase